MPGPNPATWATCAHGCASSPQVAVMKHKAYEAALEPLQLELNNLARWLAHTGKRMLVVFEGRDAAGKGGAIATIAPTLNPRQCRIVALSKPGECEAGQGYFQRYNAHLPAAHLKRGV